MNSLVQMVQMQWSTAAIPPWKEWANMCLAQLDHLNNQEDIFCDQNWQINFHFSHAFSHQPDPSATLPKTGWCDRTLVSYVRRSQAFIISKTLQKLIHGLKKKCYKCISRIKKRHLLVQNTPLTELAKSCVSGRLQRCSAGNLADLVYEVEQASHSTTTSSGWPNGLLRESLSVFAVSNNELSKISMYLKERLREFKFNYH